MSSIDFINTRVSAALRRGIRQCVLIGSGSTCAMREVFEGSLEESIQVFDRTQIASEALAGELETSNFDKHKESLFIWLGDAGHRTADAVLGAFAFIASLPKGTEVVFDYAAERMSLRSLTHTALDALASRVLSAGGIQHLIEPQAVAAMLRGFGFRQILDFAQRELPLSSGHLVSAVV